MIGLRLALMGSAAGLLLGASPAMAQQGGGFSGGGGSGRFSLPDNAPSGVLERNRPDGDPVGVRVGSFLVIPRVFATTVVDDNVFTTRTNRQSDVVFRLSPTFTASTTGAQARLAVEGGIETVNYARYGVLDAINARLGLLGRYDVNNRTSVSFGSTYLRTTDAGAGVGNAAVNPGAGSVPVFGPGALQLEPIPVTRFNQNLRLDSGFNRFEYAVAANWQNISYGQPASTRQNLAATNQAQRDGDILTFTGRFGYRISAPTSVFVETAYNSRSYRNRVFDSDGYRVAAGVSTEVARLVRGEVFAGILQQNFSSTFGSKTGLNFGARLRWFPTERLTVTAFASRDVGEPSATLAPPGLALNLGATAEVEIRRNWVASATINYARISYSGIANPDRFTALSLTTAYLINRYLSANGGYRFTMREGQTINSTYDRNQVFVGLRTQF